MSRVLVISYSRIGRDPRVLRQLSLLPANSDVTIIGFAPAPPDFTGKFISLRTDLLVDDLEFSGGTAKRFVMLALALLRRLAGMAFLPFRVYKLFYFSRPWILNSISSMRATGPFDLVIANEFETMPAISMALPATNVILDVHEYTPDESGVFFRAKLLRGYINNWLIPRFASIPKKIFSVSPGICERYKKEFGFNALMMPNAAKFENLSPSIGSSGEVHLVHHGIADPTRNIEVLIAALDLLPENYYLHLYLVKGPAANYLDYLKSRAKSNSRIYFEEPVPTHLIARTLNKYDLGLITYDNSSTNHSLSLPNKFFEYVQARLGVVVGPSIEMVEISKKFDFLVQAKEVDAVSYAAAILSISASKLSTLKQSADDAARELSFENLCAPFRDAIVKFGHS